MPKVFILHALELALPHELPEIIARALSLLIDCTALPIRDLLDEVVTFLPEEQREEFIATLEAYPE